MIIKTLFLASLLIASALASVGEGNEPFPAALLVQSNFDFSLIRDEFRVHYGGEKPGSTSTQVSINIYKPNGDVAHTYSLEEKEKEKKQAFHFALGDVEAGAYQVEVCADGACSARTPSLNNVVASSETHKLSCKPPNSDEGTISINFIEPTAGEWAETPNYAAFSNIINTARTNAAAAAAAAAGTAASATETYETDFEKHGMSGNPSYQKTAKRFHIAIMHDLRNYQQFFKKGVNDYCGRKYMLSLHAHIVNTSTRKVLHRFKTVNHLSEAGKRLFILAENGKILLESTHEGVEIENGTYDIWVSLCVTDKDTVESTYCAKPLKKNLTVADE